MTESEMNLLSTLLFEYISEVVNPAEEYNSDIQLENVLSDECIKILDDICIALWNVDKKMAGCNQNIKFSKSTCQQRQTSVKLQTN